MIKPLLLAVSLQLQYLLQLKEAKLQTLQKKCGNIEDKLKEHRSTRRKLKARFLSEEKAIEAIQTAIGKQVCRKIQFLSKGIDISSTFQNESINSMEHNNTEHKNLKEPLEALVNFVEKMDSMLREEKACLPGSILLGAAFCRSGL